jgi:AraC family transcriptional regulator, ethanolamine operon transcriptional activator
MPTQTFSSFEAFFAANLHSDLRGMVLGRRRENWVMTQLIIKTLSVQWGRAGSSVVVEGAAKPSGISIFLPTESTLGVSGNGHRLDESSLMINQTGDEFCIANDSSRPWFSVYIPYETLARATGDATTAVPLMHGFVQVPLQRIQRFRSVIGQFGEAVHRATTDFESAASQRAAEQKLVPEIRNLLAVPHEVDPTLGRHVVPRRQIIRASMDFVDLHEGEYLSVEQLAAAAGVSERTLRDAFQRYFGVPPVRYLNRRTLHQVRRALKAADRSVATVTKIATQFGVWELGRFARDYRFLFGEPPSETLRH